MSLFFLEGRMDHQDRPRRERPQRSAARSRHSAASESNTAATSYSRRTRSTRPRPSSSDAIGAQPRRSGRHRSDDRDWRKAENHARRIQRRYPNRRLKETSLPRHRKKPSGWDRVKDAWKSSWVLRIAAGIVVTLLVISSINRSISPPEGLETNEVTAEQAPVIEPSAAVEMFTPAIDVHAKFDDDNCRVLDGAINPDTMDKACTYTADDRPYSLPGTNAEDIVVIAGHTGAGVPAVFNKLYDGAANEHKVSIGDKLYVRTKNSDQNWLIYTATDLHDPDKQGLAGDSSVWGEDAMPGRLLTISCIQPANPLEAAVRNAVVGWQYEGTTHTAKDKKA